MGAIFALSSDLLQVTIVFWKGACAYTSGALVFVAAMQGTCLDHLVLVASRPYVHGSPWTVTNKKQFLPCCLPPTPARAQQRKQTEMHPQSFCGRGLLAYLYSCGQRTGFYLYAHIGADYNPLQRPGRLADAFFAFCLCTTPKAVNITATIC